MKDKQSKGILYKISLVWLYFGLAVIAMNEFLYYIELFGSTGDVERYTLIGFTGITTFSLLLLFLVGSVGDIAKHMEIYVIAYALCRFIAYALAEMVGQVMTLMVFLGFLMIILGPVFTYFFSIFGGLPVLVLVACVLAANLGLGDSFQANMATVLWLILILAVSCVVSMLFGRKSIFLRKKDGTYMNLGGFAGAAANIGSGLLRLGCKIIYCLFLIYAFSQCNIVSAGVARQVENAEMIITEIQTKDAEMRVRLLQEDTAGKWIINPDNGNLLAMKEGDKAICELGGTAYLYWNGKLSQIECSGGMDQLSVKTIKGIKNVSKEKDTRATLFTDGTYIYLGLGTFLHSIEPSSLKAEYYSAGAWNNYYYHSTEERLKFALQDMSIQKDREVTVSDYGHLAAELQTGIFLDWDDTTDMARFACLQDMRLFVYEVTEDSAEVIADLSAKYDINYSGNGCISVDGMLYYVDENVLYRYDLNTEEAVPEPMDVHVGSRNGIRFNYCRRSDGGVSLIFAASDGTVTLYDQTSGSTREVSYGKAIWPLVLSSTGQLLVISEGGEPVDILAISQ